MRAAVPERGFGLLSFPRQKMKASSRSLPFQKLKVGSRGSQISADGLSICQSQARLTLQPKEALLSGTAFDLL